MGGPWSQSAPSATGPGGVVAITLAQKADPFPCDHKDQTGRNLLNFVDSFEKDFPECAADWKLCVTKLRKLTQYNDDQWNHLIVDRKDIPAPAAPANAPYAPVLAGSNEINATVPPGPKGETVADWKHILTGADAVNFPNLANWWTVKSWLASFTALNGPATATWSGDVGSALGEYANYRQTLYNATPPSLPVATDLEKYYNQMASDDDMLGDIDGLAVAAPGMPEERFSRRLCRYYCGMGGTAFVKQRFHRACAAQGIQLSGNSVTDDSKKFIRDQIESFATGWVYAKYEKWWTLNQYLVSIKPEDLDWYTNRFIDWLQKGLASDT